MRVTVSSFSKTVFRKRLTNSTVTHPAKSMVFQSSLSRFLENLGIVILIVTVSSVGRFETAQLPTDGRLWLLIDHLISCTTPASDLSLPDSIRSRLSVGTLSSRPQPQFKRKPVWAVEMLVARPHSQV